MEVTYQNGIKEGPYHLVDKENNYEERGHYKNGEKDG